MGYKLLVAIVMFFAVVNCVEVSAHEEAKIRPVFELEYVGVPYNAININRFSLPFDVGNFILAKIASKTYRGNNCGMRANSSGFFKSSWFEDEIFRKNRPKYVYRNINFGIVGGSLSVVFHSEHSEDAVSISGNSGISVSFSIKPSIQENISAQLPLFSIFGNYDLLGRKNSLSKSGAESENQKEKSKPFNPAFLFIAFIVFCCIELRLLGIAVNGSGYRYAIFVALAIPFGFLSFACLFLLFVRYVH